MARTPITKLKLKTGATLKLAVMRDSFWDMEDFLIAFGEKYMIQKGDNMRLGLAAGATREWELDNDNTPASIVSLHMREVETFTYVLQPPPEIITEDYQGYRLFDASMFGTPSSNIGQGWIANQATLMTDGEIMLAACIDDNGVGRIAYIWSNIPYITKNYGIYGINKIGIGIPNADVWLNGAFDDSTDPYDDDSDGNDGGDGDDTNDGDIISDPDLPDIGAIDSGLINLYTATPAQLRNLASFLWSGPFDVNTFKKVFSNPMEAILGLSLVPVNIPSVAQGSVGLGNIDTGVQMGIVSAQYVKVNCGSIDVKEYWGSYLDYSPTTKFDIYLPFVGVRPLRTDDIMRKSLNVVYNVDILSGACVCFVKAGGTVLYEYAGQCSTIIPINGQNWNSAISSAISLVGSLGLAVATGGGSAPLTAAQVAGKSAVAGAAIAGNVMNSKPNIERSGGIGSSAGILANLKPFLIITRPKACVPANQNKFEGYPSYKTMRLSACSGYTEVESVHLDNIPATDTEKKEIERLLYEGVII